MIRLREEYANIHQEFIRLRRWFIYVQANVFVFRDFVGASDVRDSYFH